MQGLYITLRSEISERWGMGMGCAVPPREKAWKVLVPIDLSTHHPD